MSKNIKSLINLLAEHQRPTHVKVENFLILPTLKFTILQYLIDKESDRNVATENRAVDSILYKISVLLYH